MTFGLKLLSLDPLQEHVHRALMRLYAAQGRHDAALAQYERCRHELSTQLERVAGARNRGTRPLDTEQPPRWNGKAAGPLPPGPEPCGRPTLPDRPSIASSAVHNLSGDPEQEYFADGIVEDIISAPDTPALVICDCAQFEFYFQEQSD